MLPDLNHTDLSFADYQIHESVHEDHTLTGVRPLLVDNVTEVQLPAHELLLYPPGDNQFKSSINSSCLSLDYGAFCPLTLGMDGTTSLNTDFNYLLDEDFNEDELMQYFGGLIYMIVASVINSSHS